MSFLPLLIFSAGVLRLEKDLKITEQIVAFAIRTAFGNQCAAHICLQQEIQISFLQEGNHCLIMPLQH